MINFFIVIYRFVKHDNPEDLRNYLTRLKRVPKLLLQHKYIMAHAILNGTTLHKSGILNPIQDMRNQCDSTPENSEFYKPIQKALMLAGSSL